MIKTKLFWLKQQLLHPSLVAEYGSLIKRQFLPLDELECLNWQRRKAIVQHAYKTSDCYRKYYDSNGFHPNSLVERSDWTMVPLLTRDHIIRNREEIVSTSVLRSDLTPVTTGGSTGTVLKLYHDSRYASGLLGWRTFGMWGLSPADDAAAVYRVVPSNEPAWKRTLRKGQPFAARSILLDASSMTPEMTAKFIIEFNHLKPKILHGYMGGLQYLAEYIAASGVAVHPPLAVCSTASPLSAVQRSLFEASFQAPVYDQYGSCEVYWIAAECAKHTGLHINYDTRHVEFLDNGGRPVPEGTIGDIAITDLTNLAFPLIRYLNGDAGHAVTKSCSCGVSLPMMGPVRGRVTDTLRFPGNISIAGDYMTTIFDDYAGSVRSFQVRQAKDLSLRVLVVANTSEAELKQVLSRVVESLLHKTGGTVAIRTEIVSRIPDDRGKLRYVIKE